SFDPRIEFEPNLGGSPMTTKMRQVILRANAIYLSLAALFGWLKLDIPSIFFGRPPLGPFIEHAHWLGIGLIEAHGLALILGILLWRAPVARSWHLTGAAIHVLLGTSNLIFWPIFAATGTIVVGYVTTSLHWVFVALQLIAAVGAPSEPRVAVPVG